MVEAADMPRDLSSLVVPQRGSVEKTDDLFEPYRLVDEAGGVVGPVASYLRDVAAGGRSVGTQRSYAMDLLGWFRFLWAIEVGWDQATRLEARDFCCWIQVSDKPVRPHWRRAGQDPGETAGPGAPGRVRRAGVPNAVTGKPAPGVKYAAATVAHCETVLRSFYEFCAMRRSVISPAQRGEMGGISLDPMAYLAPKGRTGTIACQKTSGHAQAYGVMR